MLYAQLSTEDYKTLQEELDKTTDKKWYQRLKSIQLSHEGYGVPKIAEIFDLNQHTIRKYIKRYRDGGIEGLQRDYAPGASPKVPQQKEYWEEVLRQSPCQFEKLNTGARNWTQELLVTYCQHHLGVTMTQSAISGLFKRLGIRWNRSRLRVSSPDPLYQVKRQRIDDLKKKPTEES